METPETHDLDILLNINDLIELSDDEFDLLQKSIQEDPSLGLMTPEEINCLISNINYNNHENEDKRNDFGPPPNNQIHNSSDKNVSQAPKQLRRSSRLLLVNKKTKYY